MQLVIKTSSVGLPMPRTVHAATGLEADGIVARIDVAAFDADVFAGINVDAVAAAA